MPTTDEFKDLFEKMSALAPSERLSTEEVLQHRFLQSQQFVMHDQSCFQQQMGVPEDT